MILSNNVAAVNKNLAMTEHVYSMVVPIMSQKLWDSMSDEDKAAMEEVAAEMLTKDREIARAQNDEALDKLKEDGMVVTYPDKAAFIEATQPIRDEYGAQYSDILEAAPVSGVPPAAGRRRGRFLLCHTGDHGTVQRISHRGSSADSGSAKEAV